MSESSQSLHFWRADADQIRAWSGSGSSTILARFVTSNSCWSSALTYEQEDAEALALAASGLVLLWRYDDDYALDLRFYRDKQVLGSASFIWRGNAEQSSAKLPGALVTALLEAGALNAAAQADLAEVARAVSADEIRGRVVRDRVGALLNLPAYEWLSSATCLEQRIEGFREEFPDAEDLFE